MTKQLALPPELRIKKAKVSSLQITVPTDLFSSSIEVIAVGIHICLELSSTPAQQKKSTRKAKPEAAQDTELVPTAADLAQSFLETQPSKEKIELEHALAVDRQDLAASVASSEDGSEDDLAVGTGQLMSVPAFLTNFLHGVVDRTRVSIRDVTFEFEIEVPVEPRSSETELVALRASLKELHVEGVTTQAAGDGISKIVHQEGKRHILLREIRAFIVSKADVFSCLTRSPSVTSAASRSPVAFRSPVATTRAPSLIPEISFAPSLQGMPSARSIDGFDHRQRLLDDSEEALQIPYEMDDDDGKDGAQQQAQSSPLSTPRASIYHDSSDQGSSGQVETSNHSPPAGEETNPWPPTLESLNIEDQKPDQNSATVSEPASDDSGREPPEDLTQSRYFSHDEAQSLYMSAYSQTGSHMPGAWGSHPASPELSPRTNSGDAPATSSHSPFAPADDPTQKSPQVKDLRKEPEPSSPASWASQDESITDQHVRVPAPAEVTPKPSTDNLAQEVAEGGPPKHMKEIVSLDCISVYVPTRQKSPPTVPAYETTPLAESTYPTVPGAFSVHSNLGQASNQETRQAAEEANIGGAVEVNFAPLECRFDASIGFLLATVVQRLLEILKKPQSPEKPAPAASQASTALMPEIQVSMQRISVLFVDKIFGTLNPRSAVANPAADFGSHTLLRIELEGIKASTTQFPAAETNITVGRFRFGYHDSDILSFVRDVPLGTSMRDTFPDAGADIAVKLSSTTISHRCEVTTLPLRVHVDLQRLDETFNWFGGLSGFLQMSASMSSNTTHEKPIVKPSKPRGVRFDIPSHPESTDTGLQNKIYVRFGGVWLDLEGKICGIRLRTSAVKVASQASQLGVAVDRVEMSGPYTESTGESPPVKIMMGFTRLEYFFTPRETDLDRLLALITPSKGQFDEEDDEIMVDTLLRQRRKGSVLNFKVEAVQVTAGRLKQLESIPALGEELSKLGAVAKYLPEDDRPGLLTLAFVDKFEASVDVGGRFGVVNAKLGGLELAHITFPSLAAIGVNSIAVDRNRLEELVGSNDDSTTGLPSQSPVLMVRMIGNQMEPVIKVRMQNINFEYRVPTIMDALGMSSDTTPQEFDTMLAASVANLGERAHHALVRSESSMPQASTAADTEPAKPTVVNVAFRDCLLGLNPLGMTSRLAIVLIDSRIEVSMPVGDDVSAKANLRKAALLLVDDVSVLEEKNDKPIAPRQHRGSDAKRPADMLTTLSAKGYANICQISSARLTAEVTNDSDGERQINTELRDTFVVLETCADSFHTLTMLAGALKPPTPPSREVKYRTEVIPVEDLLASVSGDAFGRAEGAYNFEDDFAVAAEDELSDGELIDVSPLGLRTQPTLQQLAVSENLFDATSSSVLSSTTTAPSVAPTAAPHAGPISTTTHFGTFSPSDIDENFFKKGPAAAANAYNWDSKRNRYNEVSVAQVQASPLKARIRDVHVIWNLFDGYDWQRTRDTITKNVEEVENQAFEKRNRSGRKSMDELEFDDEDIVGDCLFNSIYVSIPANHDPRELVKGINAQLDDAESIAGTTVTATTTRTSTGQFRSRAKKLRLGRSKRHKITFELSGVNADLVQFPPGSGETDTSIDVRVMNFDVFDHVPTSTWRKFATYDHDAGERELGASMAHIKLLVVKPLASLAASEFVLKATVLPLRLHVDQDALNFIERFFQFKDETQAPVHSSPSDEAFIQRADIDAIPVVLDFKPKRVDYAGLRKGRTSEFMNFVTLEGSKLTLSRLIVYGTSGWPKLGEQLNNIWTPHVKKTQLGSVLAGVGPGRHLVNVVSGVRHLVDEPYKQYQKDGRIMRGVVRGVHALVWTSGTEVVKFGAKAAVGAQNLLQNVEGALNPADPSEGIVNAAGNWDGEDAELDEERKLISLYADQPTNVVQGLQHAYHSMARDLATARDAVIAVPGQVREMPTAQGAAKAVARNAPTIILRPLIAVTGAAGQALMGATNSLDPDNLRRVDDVRIISCWVNWEGGGALLTLLV